MFPCVDLSQSWCDQELNQDHEMSFATLEVGHQFNRRRTDVSVIYWETFSSHCVNGS